jgi:hypothetical protein
VKALGGFFELEPGRRSREYHEEATALCSGRACLRLMLEARRPRRALLPFFICDSALSAFDAAHVPYSFYRVTPALEAALPQPLDDVDCVLYVNYFGLKTPAVRALESAAPAWVIADDTQAFFERGYARAASFNSARKFFGVPDGAYAYGENIGAAPEMRLDETGYLHLVNRLTGHQELAYRQYLEHERAMTPEVRGPSRLAEQILAGIDYEHARDIRCRNYLAVHDRLAPVNRLAIDLVPLDAAVPFCYPLLPVTPLDRQRLWRRQIFVSHLWPEVEARPGDGFDWERELAARLLPLPIDQRYDLADMDRLCTVVLEELR